MLFLLAIADLIHPISNNWSSIGIFGEGEGQLDRWRAKGGLNPFAQESKARTGRFLREKLSSDHGHFSSYEGHMERRTGKIRGDFSRMHRALDGLMLARAPASPAQGLHHHGPRYFNFPYNCTMCGPEKLGIVDQNWLKRICPICCWERWSWVGDNNPSRSRLLSIWSKGVLIDRFVIGWCHRL